MASPVLVLAEDDRDLRGCLTEFLTLEGFRVLPAANGVAALRLLRYQPGPCKLLLDISMPIMGGMEVLEELTSNPSFPPVDVVIFTAGETKLAGLESMTVLRKPVEPSKLLEALKVDRQCCA